MSEVLTEKELIEFLKIQKDQIDKLQEEREHLKINVLKYQTLNEQEGPVKTFLGITRDFGLGFFERRRFLNLIRATQDVIETKVIFKIGTPTSRFYLELTYPQLTGLIKLIATTIAGLWLLFTTGSTIWFKFTELLPF